MSVPHASYCWPEGGGVYGEGSEKAGGAITDPDELLVVKLCVKRYIHVSALHRYGIDTPDDVGTSRPSAKPTTEG